MLFYATETAVIIAFLFIPSSPCPIIAISPDHEELWWQDFHQHDIHCIVFVPK